MNYDLSPQITRETNELKKSRARYDRNSKIWLCVGVAALAFQAYVTVVMIKDSSDN